ncbi:MAG: nucleotide exchange factor GrpE [Deltaproteobacteria bacterium]|nr:nucleotide exchange factor GrpE [Deltaproteobacteria bacterium]
MSPGKKILKEHFINFQVKIAELTHRLAEQENFHEEKERAFYLSLLDILDAFENIEERIEEKKETFDKPAFMLSKNIRSIHKKFIRLMKAGHIVLMEFPDNKARMALCKIIDTRVEPKMENETILSVVKKGYVRKKDGAILRKAEVITVLNAH